MLKIQRVIILGFCFLIFACGGGGSGDTNTVELPQSPDPDVLHTLSGTPATSVNEDEEYAFQVTVNNSDNDPLTFSLDNAPSWLSISNTGLVSGMANTDADTGIFADIVISATDNKQNTVSLPAFTLSVYAVNDTAIITLENSSFSADGRSTFTIPYTIEDEENSASISLEGLENFISYTVLQTEIEITVADINEVISDTITMVAGNGADASRASIELQLYPMNASGLGRTIKGKREGSGVHLLILGDGYQETELSTYEADAFKFIDILYSDPDISEHLSVWNVHVVNMPSNDSGIDDTYNTDTADTVFNSGYNCQNIQRLICANTSTVFATLADEYPWAGEVVLIVNSEQYGGSGGAISIYNRTSPEIALHEMGHSFASLADEYVDSQLADDRAQSYVQGRYANVSNSNDPLDAPWAHWIDDLENYPSAAGETGVGVFEGSYYNATGFYRPQYDSRMRSNNANFGPVNAEQWLLNTYAGAGGAINEVSPESATINLTSGESISLSAVPTFNVHVQNISWFLNGDALNNEAGNESISLTLAQGTHSVVVSLNDATGKIRTSDYSYIHEESFEWTITVD
ncbi:M64 family metallopeptidase [Glaciecola sp. 2405UD65-10]|uniref:M64 family metallopeptidase n=1 Tax=Glaciecola sp. 2405UD65-10 TaxID=3397244 RepID=UPI003B59C041